MLRARLISGVPADLVGWLTGLTEGRFPVYARARLKLLEATAIHRADGRNVLGGGNHLSIGQIFLMPKPLLQRRVLHDERVDVYPCGRRDIRSGAATAA